jgi:hypothetical protein
VISAAAGCQLTRPDLVSIVMPVGAGALAVTVMPYVAAAALPGRISS